MGIYYIKAFESKSKMFVSNKLYLCIFVYATYCIVEKFKINFFYINCISFDKLHNYSTTKKI